MVELEHVTPSGSRVYRLGGKPLYIGRAPTNDLVLPERTVSGRHAALWLAAGLVYIEDLNSRNGTFVDEVRIKGIQAVEPGAKIRIGDSAVFHIRGEPPSAGFHVPLLEDVATGVRHAFRSDRFAIGSAHNCDIVLGEGPEVAAMLIVHIGGDVSLGVDDNTHDLEWDEAFTVGGREFRIRRSLGGGVTETHDLEPTRYPYEIEATLDGARGPEATLLDSNKGSSCKVLAPNRAILLYLLGRKFADDKAEGTHLTECGWLYDGDIVTGIWGRSAGEGHLNNLNVLTSRVRTELKSAGFDPWCIEKRRRHLRIRVAAARIG